MPRYFAFLRAINVGGHTVTMDRLRELFHTLDLADVETFIASGNVIFSTSARKPDALERKIERHLESELGFEVKTFLRTDDDLAAVAAYEPFISSAGEDGRPPSVGFLHQPLGRGAAVTLKGMRTATDDFHLHGREVYWLCQTGQTDSKFSGAVFERTFGLPVTFRTMNTVRRMAKKYLG